MYRFCPQGAPEPTKNENPFSFFKTMCFQRSILYEDINATADKKTRLSIVIVPERSITQEVLIPLLSTGGATCNKMIPSKPYYAFLFFYTTG